MQGLISIFQISDSGEQEVAEVLVIMSESGVWTVEPSWGLLTEWSSLEPGQRTHPAHWPLVLPPAETTAYDKKTVRFYPECVTTADPRLSLRLRMTKCGRPD